MEKFIEMLANRAKLLPSYTPTTVKHRPKNHRKMDPKSLTIPDQSMPLQTILERYSRGLPVSGTNLEPIWDDQEHPNFATMDLSEKIDMARQVEYDNRQRYEREETNRKIIEANNIRQQIRDELALEFEKQNQSA
jgi:hypothetical protein